MKFRLLLKAVLSQDKTRVSVEKGKDNQLGNKLSFKCSSTRTIYCKKDNKTEEKPYSFYTRRNVRMLLSVYYVVELIQLDNFLSYSPSINVRLKQPATQKNEMCVLFFQNIKLSSWWHNLEQTKNFQLIAELHTEFCQKVLFHWYHCSNIFQLNFFWLCRVCSRI